LEVDLLRREQVEERDVVAAKAQVLERAFELGGVHKKIGDDHDQSALADFLGGGVDGLQQSGLAGWFELFELIDHKIQVGGTAFGRDFLAVVGPDTPKADGVALMGGEVGEAGGELAGEVHPVPAAGRGVGVIHGAAGIDDEAEAEVGVGLKFLDIKAI
jgi:hypothetical protein